MAEQHQGKKPEPTKSDELTPAASKQPAQGGQPTPSSSISQAGGSGVQRRAPSGSLAAAGNPFALMRQLADEMDRVFENFGFGRSRFGLPPWPAKALAPGQLSTWSPQVEVFEQGGRLIVRADIPGLKKEDLKVELMEDALVIQGERKQEEHEDKEGFYRSERSYGSFYRAIPLPEGTSPEGATARFKDGVLEVSLQAPLKEEKRGKPIQVQ